MKKLLTLFLLSATMVVTAQTDKRLKGVEKELNAILKETNAAGFAVAVVVKDRIVYAKGFGYRDVEKKLPVDENTLFAIGSCSKAFTSSILGQLEEEGKLKLTDNPRKYVPDLEFYNNDINNQVTIQDLMSHRTGVPRHDYSWYLFPTTDREALLHRIQFHEPFTGFREQWYYNNFMFLAQGVIAERITGKSWEDNIRERFFKPLEMSRSNLNIEELEGQTNVAVGYAIVGDTALEKQDYYRIGGMAPAGSINSSVNEMGNWLITWINGGKFKGNQILPESYVRDAMSSHMVIEAALPSTEFPDIHMANYGYGWMLSSYQGHYEVEHGGAIDGFRASTAFYPTDSIGIVVLTNQGGAPVTSLVRKTIAERMLQIERTDWVKEHKERKAEQANAEQPEKVEEADVKPKSAHLITDFIGVYNHPGYGDFTVSIENDSLYAVFPIMKMYLRNRHYDVFEMFDVKNGKVNMEEETSVFFNFITNDGGEISGVDLKLEPAIDHPIEFKRTPVTIEVDNSVMKSYEGEYELSGMIIKVYTKGETLYLFVAGQPEYELLPTEKHKFNFKIVDGYKVEFIEDQDKAITELKLIQPNGTFVAKRK